MKKNILKVLFITSISLNTASKSIAQLISGDVFLQGTYAEFGIAPNGAFGSGSTPPSGYHPRPLGPLGFVADTARDGWTVGTPAYIGDFFIPGTQQEGWAISIGGSLYKAYRGLGTTMTAGLTGSNVSYDSAYLIKTVWQGEIASSSLSIKQTTALKTDEIYGRLDVVLKNNGASTIYDIFYTRTVDPDNEAAMGGSFSTDNKIVSQIPHPSNHVLVTARGTTFNSLLALGTKDTRAKAYILGSGLFPPDNLADVYNGTGLASGLRYDTTTTYSGDVGIGIVYKLDSLEAGDSTTISYAYMLDASAIATAFADIPDPSALSLNFMSFRANQNKCNITLNWDYNSDEMMENFIIERSGNGKSYTAIGNVKNDAKSFVDKNPLPGRNLYRIRANSKNNAYYYSPTKLVVNTENCENLNIKVRPNPAKNFVEVSAPFKYETIYYSITNISGETKLNGVLNANEKQVIDISALSSGTYIINFQLNNIVHYSTIVVL